MDKTLHKTRSLRLLLMLLLSLICSNFSLAQSEIETLIEHAVEFEEQADIKGAVEIYQKAIDLCQNMENQQQLPLLLFKQASLYCYTADYDSAIQNLIRAYELNQKSDEPDLELEARTLVQLGIVYFFMRHWDNALMYYEKAWTIALRLNNKEGLSIIRNNIGNIYQKKGDYSKAIESYQQTLKIQQELQDSATICNATYNIASCYFENKKPEQAHDYLVKAYEIASAISDVEISVLSLILLGGYYVEKQMPSVAYERLDLAEKIALDSGYRQLLLEVYKKKSSFQEAAGHYQGALLTQKKLHQLSDSIFNENSMAKLHDFQTKYETLEKENKIQLQELSLKRKNIQFVALLSGLLLTLIIVVLLILFYRLQRLRNRELVELNATRDKFYTILSHDLKNPILIQRNTLQLLVDNIDELDKKTILEDCSELLRVLNQQIELLHNLLNWGQLKTNLLPSTPILFDINSAIEEAAEFSEALLKEKKLRLNCELTEQAVAFGNKRLSVIALRNLLANAIKFSYSGNEIKIRVDLNKNKMWEISVIDYGVGISADRLLEIFTLSKSTKGTEGEFGSGLGLLIVKEAVEKNGGEVRVDSEIGKGSTFTFTIQQGEN